MMLVTTHDGGDDNHGDHDENFVDDNDTYFLLASVRVEEVMSVRLAGMVDSGHCGEDPHLVVAP